MTKEPKITLPAIDTANTVVKRLSPELEPSDGRPEREPDDVTELPAEWAPDEDEV